MKKYLTSATMAIAMCAGVASCSQGGDLYDANAVEQNKQAQKELQQLQQIENLKKAYSDAFTKEFGTIAPNHDWGFGSTAAKTRGVWNEDFSSYELPAIIKNNVGKNFDKTFNSSKATTVTELPQFIKDGTYILQHVFKQTSNGSGNGTGTNDSHHQEAQLQAYDFVAGAWIDVTNFVGGQNVHHIVDHNGKKMTKGCTMLANMGTPTEGQPLFQWVAKQNSNSPDDVCSNYIIKEYKGEYYLGMGYNNTNKKQYDAWIIKIVPATAINPNETRGRIFCEDLGNTGDIDFNDIVFDATIKSNGNIEVKVLAAGGTLPVWIGGVKVNLGEMTNTGVNNNKPVQEFTIPASKGYKTLNQIPVEVQNGDLKYELTAEYGEAPGKICTYINVPWADEYVKISKAYVEFKTWVNGAAPVDWFLNRDEELTDLDLTNNNK
jgi:hypothetical protein